MPSLDRRGFIQLAGGSAALAALPQTLAESIARAASIPAHTVTGTIQDVEHVIVLMQENRSFDHYFGTMRGVRGYADPHPAARLGASGQSVFHQPDGTREVLPFRPDVEDLGLVFLQDLDHSWDGGHAAFAAGRYDQWVPIKTATTMAHLERRDIPFHYALADAFTICDAYHCSLLGPTDPNRYYPWSGWVGNDGQGGGPVIANDELGYGWTTYPERLQAAGVSWKVYQDRGLGLDAAGSWGWTDDAYIGNYGDNSLLYFDAYRDAAPSSPLYRRARTGTHAQAGESFFHRLGADVRAGRLPQVSYVVAPEAFTEHPNWPANYGAWYVARVLDALTSDPDVWSRTALFLTYDENDGFFDHVVPPYASGLLPGDSTVDTSLEQYAGPAGVPGPYGLGQRVPMTVISPWSTGGQVCSETFDHTSVIRFLEQRFGVHEPQITPWRRAVCGDLTSAFDFATPQAAVPALPGTGRYRPRDDQRHPDYVPDPPADPALPRQEAGTRPSRRLGYALTAQATVTPARASGAGGTLAVALTNAGSLGAQVQARALTGPLGGPFSYTVEAGKQLAASWAVADCYDVALHGPHGAYWRLAGRVGDAALEVAFAPQGADLRVIVTNDSAERAKVRVADAFAGGGSRVVVPAGGQVVLPFSTVGTGGWYDVSVSTSTGFLRQVSGRIEAAATLTSDPRLG